MGLVLCYSRAFSTCSVLISLIFFLRFCGFCAGMGRAVASLLRFAWLAKQRRWDSGAPVGPGRA